MINVGVCVNLKCGNEIFFIVVCKIENVDVVEELINVGVDVNVFDGYYIFFIVLCLRNN